MPTVKQVDIENSLYKGPLLTKYHALLVGGNAFNAMKKEFLLRKPSEGFSSIRSSAQQAMPNSGSPGSGPSPFVTYQPQFQGGGMNEYDYRLRKTSYKPMISSLFGYLAARIFPKNPTISGDLKDLVEDADGRKKSLASLMREALINALTYSISDCPTGSYIQLCDVDGDVKLSLVDQRSIIDWEEDDDGDLEWVRTRSISKERDADGRQSKNRWLWKIWKADNIQTYEGIGQQIPTEISGPSTAVNEMGICPFIRVDLAEYQFLLDQLAPILTEQFNLEADIASLCSKISNAQWVLKTSQKQVGSCVIPALGIWIIDPGDDAGYKSPDPECCKPLFEYRNALREELYNSINASAMRASADLVQNPRQSANAKELDLEPFRAWSETFSAPVRTAFTIAINHIADFMEIDEPEITWPEPLDISQAAIKSIAEGKPPPVTVPKMDKENI
jgi:hypothetical protein